jgi:23S rRNA (adenine2503-C2)-methyltransferase
LKFAHKFCIIATLLNKWISVKQSLLGLSLAELKELMQKLGEKPFRAIQLYEWIYQKNVLDFDEMSNLSQPFRDMLKENFVIRTMSVEEATDIGDTVKFLWRLQDGQMVESVLMPSESRVTICISSQVGCAVDCQFCATGKMGFKRNLTAGEIIEQILQISDRFDRRISNIVYMGMGEPFLNYENVIKSANILNDEKAFGIAAKKITISTSGIIPRIYDFANEGHKFRLAISLNHVDQERRTAVMPLTKKYTLEELLKASYYYTNLSGEDITFEYVMIDNNNTSPRDAALLKDLIKNLNCKINLIPCNSRDPLFTRPSEETMALFKELLERSRKPILIRQTRGRSIDAACGMLANKINQQNTLPLES